MQPITNKKGIHPCEPACEIESCFDSNIFYYGMKAWQQASVGIRQQYQMYALAPDEFHRMSGAMERQHCQEEYLKAALPAMFEISGRGRWFDHSYTRQVEANMYLSIASYTQSKTFGADATEGDLITFFFSHPELEQRSWFELMDNWRNGDYLPLLSLLYECMEKAAEAYERILHKYGDYAIQRVGYSPDLGFMPLSDVLDTEYFLLHALIELVEPKLGRC